MKASEIAAFLGAALQGADLDVSGPASLASAREGAVVFAATFSAETEQRLNAGPRVLALVGEAYRGRLRVPHVVTLNARLAFARVLGRFFSPTAAPGIAASAIVAPGALLGADVRIGEYAVVEAGARIGDRTELRHHVVVGANARLGNDCLVKSQAVIGEEGFGFDFDEARVPVRMPHLGGVRIGDRVEIGAGARICRGTLDDTVIADNVKLDDLVYIAHNATIGEATLVIGGAAVCGSARIGRRCWIAPGATIMQGIAVGDDAVIGLGAVVIRDVPAGDVVAGNPARSTKGPP